MRSECFAEPFAGFENITQNRSNIFEFVTKMIIITTCLMAVFGAVVVVDGIVEVVNQGRERMLNISG